MNPSSTMPAGFGANGLPYGQSVGSNGTIVSSNSPSAVSYSNGQITATPSSSATADDIANGSKSLLANGFSVGGNGQPSGLSGPLSIPTAHNATYTVGGYNSSTGEGTLSGIAKALGVSTSSLLQTNPSITDPNKIYKGQQLLIPGSHDAPTPTYTPTPGLNTDLTANGQSTDLGNTGINGNSSPSSYINSSTPQTGLDQDTANQVAQANQYYNGQIGTITDQHNAAQSTYDKYLGSLQARNDAQIQNINNDFDQQQQSLKLQQAHDVGSTSLSLARMGGYLGDSASSIGYLNQLNNTNAIAVTKLNVARAQAVQAANDAIADKDFAGAQAKIKEAQDYETQINSRYNSTFSQIEQIQNDSLNRQKTYLDMQSTVADQLGPQLYHSFTGDVTKDYATAQAMAAASGGKVSADALMSAAQKYGLQVQQVNASSLDVQPNKDIFGRTIGYSLIDKANRKVVGNVGTPLGGGDNSDISSYFNVQPAPTGDKYIDTTSITNPTLKAAAVKYANQMGIGIVSNESDRQTLNAASTAMTNQQTMLQQIIQYLPKDAQGRPMAAVNTTLNDLIQNTSDEDQKAAITAAFKSWNGTAVETIKATEGLKGVRFGDAQIKSANDNDVIKLTDTVATALQTYDNIYSQIKSGIAPIIKPSNTSSSSKDEVFTVMDKTTGRTTTLTNPTQSMRDTLVKSGKYSILLQQ